MVASDHGAALFRVLSRKAVRSVAKEFARALYKSKEWSRVREYVRMRDKKLCVRCFAPGEEVHHRTYLTPDNINDPNIALNPSNLMLLCRDCHQREHERERTKRVQDVGMEFDADGMPLPPGGGEK